MGHSFILIAFIIVMVSCEEEKLTHPDTLQEITADTLQEITEEALIIGVDPCSFPYGHSGKVDSQDGFVLRLVESNDTVVTYNLPKGIVKTVDYLENNYLFREEKRDSLNLIITYKRTPKEEKYYPLCLANIYIGDFSRAVGDRQVIVINSERID